MKNNKTIRLALALLIPYPHQTRSFDKCSEADDAAVAADLRKRGQRDPIVILPPNNAARLPAYTILDGHRRAALLAANGETEATVLIRHDLKAADALAVEDEFLSFNGMRRQLHLLERARSIKRQYELEKKRAPGALRPFEQRAARDRVSKVLGISGRHFDRYYAILDTPLPVQRAVSNKLMKVVDGDKIARLPKTQQEQIAQQIASATSRSEVAAILRTHMEARITNRHRRTSDAFASLVRSLEKHLADLEDRATQVSAMHVGKNLRVLDRAETLIKQLRVASNRT